MRRKWVFWGFFSLDYKAMETFLEQMAAKGWMLKRVGYVFAVFARMEPQQLSFSVDVFKDGGPLVRENSPQAMGYRQLIEESGWDFITSRDYMQFFCAKPHTTPPPIHTDLQLEQKIVSSSLWKNETFFLTLLLVYLLYTISKFVPFDYKNLLSFIGIASMAAIYLLSLPVVFMLFYALLWQIRSRISIAKGRPISKPTLKGARRRAVFYHTAVFVPALLMLTALFVALANGTMKVTTLLSLVFPIVAAGLMRFYVKRRSLSKSEGVTKVIVGTILIVIISNTILFATMDTSITEQKKPAGEVIAIWTAPPYHYPLLTLKDLSEQPPGEILMQDFQPGTSPLVPKHYTYLENRGTDYVGQGIPLSEKKTIYPFKGMTISYYETIHPYVARLIYEGRIKNIESYNYPALQGKVTPAGAATTTLWQADEMVFTELFGKGILLRRGNQVLHLSGELDLDADSVRKAVIQIYWQ